jgi:hypothetical protein
MSKIKNNNFLIRASIDDVQYQLKSVGQSVEIANVWRDSTARSFGMQL